MPYRWKSSSLGGRLSEWKSKLLEVVHAFDSLKMEEYDSGSSTKESQTSRANLKRPNTGKAKKKLKIESLQLVVCKKSLTFPLVFKSSDKSAIPNIPPGAKELAITLITADCLLFGPHKLSHVFARNISKSLKCGYNSVSHSSGTLDRQQRSCHFLPAFLSQTNHMIGALDLIFLIRVLGGQFASSYKKASWSYLSAKNELPSVFNFAEHISSTKNAEKETLTKANRLFIKHFFLITKNPFNKKFKDAMANLGLAVNKDIPDKGFKGWTRMSFDKKIQVLKNFFPWLARDEKLYNNLKQIHDKLKSCKFYFKTLFFVKEAENAFESLQSFQNDFASNFEKLSTLELRVKLYESFLNKCGRISEDNSFVNFLNLDDWTGGKNGNAFSNFFNSLTRISKKDQQQALADLSKAINCDNFSGLNDKKKNILKNALQNFLNELRQAQLDFSIADVRVHLASSIRSWIEVFKNHLEDNLTELERLKVQVRGTDTNSEDINKIDSELINFAENYDQKSWYDFAALIDRTTKDKRNGFSLLPKYPRFRKLLDFGIMKYGLGPAEWFFREAHRLSDNQSVARILATKENQSSQDYGKNTAERCVNAVLTIIKQFVDNTAILKIFRKALTCQSDVQNTRWKFKLSEMDKLTREFFGEIVKIIDEHFCKEGLDHRLSKSYLHSRGFNQSEASLEPHSDKTGNLETNVSDRRYYKVKYSKAKIKSTLAEKAVNLFGIRFFKSNNVASSQVEQEDQVLNVLRSVQQFSVKSCQDLIDDLHTLGKNLLEEFAQFSDPRERGDSNVNVEASERKAATYEILMRKALFRHRLLVVFWNITRAILEPPNLQEAKSKDGESNLVKMTRELSSIYPDFKFTDGQTIFHYINKSIQLSRPRVEVEKVAVRFVQEQNQNKEQDQNKEQNQNKGKNKNDGTSTPSPPGSNEQSLPEFKIDDVREASIDSFEKLGVPIGKDLEANFERTCTVSKRYIAYIKKCWENLVNFSVKTPLFLLRNHHFVFPVRLDQGPTLAVVWNLPSTQFFINVSCDFNPNLRSSSNTEKKLELIKDDSKYCVIGVDIGDRLLGVVMVESHFSDDHVSAGGFEQIKIKISNCVLLSNPHHQALRDQVKTSRALHKFGINPGLKNSRARESAVKDYLRKLFMQIVEHAKLQKDGRIPRYVFAFEDDVDGLESGADRIKVLYESIKKFIIPKRRQHFLDQRTYLGLSGKLGLSVKAKNTSRLCPYCGHINEQGTAHRHPVRATDNLDTRFKSFNFETLAEVYSQIRGNACVFTCKNCSKVLDAELTAAFNVAMLGMFHLVENRRETLEIKEIQIANGSKFLEWYKKTVASIDGLEKLGEVLLPENIEII
ncbi:MAG: hypothetical protein QXL01_03645 [Thermoplasmatales archaeon]